MQQNNKFVLILTICGWTGFFMIISGWITFSTDVGKILLGIGIVFSTPYVLLRDSKNYENLTPIERVRFITIIIFLPLLIFGFVYFIFLR
jgi:hypothetical protein